MQALSRRYFGKVRMTRPVKFRWAGAAMIPLAPALAKSLYTVDEVYPLEVREERSGAAHNHYFAVINEGWQNLPEIETLRFPTADHLRKWLLIKAGYYSERQIVVASAAEAVRVASFIKPMDDYAVVVPKGATVSVFTARSQSMKAQGRKEFQASKDAVLNLLAEMIGVERRALEQNAGKAA